MKVVAGEVAGSVNPADGPVDSNIIFLETAGFLTVDDQMWCGQYRFVLQWCKNKLHNKNGFIETGLFACVNECWHVKCLLDSRKLTNDGRTDS